MMDSPHICPKCNKPTVVKDNMFYWEGTYMKGRVCEPCNNLYVYDEEPTIFDLSRVKVEDDEQL